jgi:hypothetical protein
MASSSLFNFTQGTQVTPITPIDYLLRSSLIPNLPYVAKNIFDHSPCFYALEDQYQQLINLLIQPKGFVEAQKMITNRCYQLVFNTKTDLNHDNHMTNMFLICCSLQPENVMLMTQHAAPISSHLLLKFIQKAAQFNQPNKIQAFLQIFKLLVINMKKEKCVTTHHDILLLLSSLGCFRAIQFLCEHQPIFYELFLENLKLYLPVLKPFIGYINLQYHVWWKDIFLFSSSS